ncbi:RNA polymerase subunit sigma [Thioclava sp. SK-1]|uniref:RNA polymerase sigma factor n=1 Tax=Thioclava sp. SK-1 TaxID=1889770 RepID=UPI000825A3B2|nr:RNA polymerase sigma factor [Thioclava sp. SK-1]OCX64557.1 RNA polymerase subunit sigma [Thioclava sp. SK-1]
MNMALDSNRAVSDEALLILYGNGDRSAARDLTLRMGPLAFRVAMRMLRDTAEAEDVAQDALLRLWKIAPEWRKGEAKVTTWLYRVTANLATDRLRKRRVLGLDEAPEIEDDSASPYDRMIDDARAQALQSALDQLPERQREAVILRHIEGLSNPQIAVAMETGVEAVESLTARGKRALTALLKGQREALGYDHD